MKENGINFDSLVRHLRSRYKEADDIAIEGMIREFLRKNPEASRHQIFNSLADGKGKGKSHASGLRKDQIR